MKHPNDLRSIIRRYEAERLERERRRNLDERRPRPGEKLRHRVREGDKIPEKGQTE